MCGEYKFENNWVLYIHRNKLNGKIYIGITSNLKPERRWNNGNGYKANPHFYSAILEYGWDNFEHNILMRDMTGQQAKHLEKEFIRIMNATDNAVGYDMTTGGDGTCGVHPSDETRRKLSECRRRENLSEYTRAKRSESLRNRKLSEEHKKKIGIGNSKPIEMRDTNGNLINQFRSAIDAEISTGISHSHISQCCNGQRATSGGYKWNFAQ